jgi:hypothetical protein
MTLKTLIIRGLLFFLGRRKLKNGRRQSVSAPRDRHHHSSDDDLLMMMMRVRLAASSCSSNDLAQITPWPAVLVERDWQEKLACCVCLGIMPRKSTGSFLNEPLTRNSTDDHRIRLTSGGDSSLRGSIQRAKFSFRDDPDAMLSRPLRKSVSNSISQRHQGCRPRATSRFPPLNNTHATDSLSLQLQTHSIITSLTLPLPQAQQSLVHSSATNARSLQSPA